MDLEVDMVRLMLLLSWYSLCAALRAGEAVSVVVREGEVRLRQDVAIVDV